jgi:hypothetical protein
MVAMHGSNWESRTADGTLAYIPVHSDVYDFRRIHSPDIVDSEFRIQISIFSRLHSRLAIVRSNGRPIHVVIVLANHTLDLHYGEEYYVSW